MIEYTEIVTKQFRGSGFMTCSKYNNSGDIIYVGDKESKLITAIETYNYSIIGTFEGHNGVIWNFDLSKDDNILISASGDLSIIFWNALNGKILHQNFEKCIPKYVSSLKSTTSSNNYVAIVCEAISKRTPSYISIFNLNDIGKDDFSETKKIIWKRDSKPTVCIWLSDNIIAIGSTDGYLIIKDILVDELEYVYQIHSEQIKSIVFNKTKQQILTSSSDTTAKQFDITNIISENNIGEVLSKEIPELPLLKVYKSTVPVNYASFNHNDSKVYLGGGIEAMMVAKTSNNDLNIKIYRTNDQKLTHHISSHFGPVRYIDKSPNSKNFITASQDGTVKIYLMHNDKDTTKLSKKYTLFGTIDEQDPETLIIGEETNKIQNLLYKPPKVIPVPKVNTIVGFNPIENTKSKKETKETKEIKETIEANVTSSPSDTELFQIKRHMTTNIFKPNNNNNTYTTIFSPNETTENTTVRITNLPMDIDVKQLSDIFDLFGRIEERGIRIKHYNDNTMAFIKYSYLEGAEKAIKSMDGRSIEHQIIKVEMAKPFNNNRY